ncbi:hypothetical protein Y032_0323g2492 [Ancylostoma ceylanicum]|uniref:Uncharacterized protein n=1 Tax=Ancylostoma ceylanicum TaxID=53326 RepID=A0A016S1I8_9BILA|nr:hypothetical protein Y032_0323g2492 [Ancylostoma ceylanicum]
MTLPPVSVCSPSRCSWILIPSGLPVSPMYSSPHNLQHLSNLELGSAEPPKINTYQNCCRLSNVDRK